MVCIKLTQRQLGLRSLRSASGDRLSLKLSDIDFLFDGHCVLTEHTPDQLKMKNGDVIKALPGQQEGVINLDDENQRTSTSASINIKVMHQDGGLVTFRMQKSTKMKKLMTAYCHRKSMCCAVFLHDGCLRDDHTPDEAGIEADGEIPISAMIHINCPCSQRAR